MMKKVLLSILLGGALVGTALGGEFPRPKFTVPYEFPRLIAPPVKSAAWSYIDTAALVLAMSVGAYLVLKRRSRRGVFVLVALSLLYFGFYRKGCVCAIGSIQNVAMSIGPNGYALPWVVAAFFALPLIFTLFFGRVFCGTTCPLGAIQDVVLWKAVRVPGWLEKGLGLFPFMYLGLAVVAAYLGADYLICRYDPFVGFFRLSGPPHMLFLGGVLLAMCVFVGRTYCRFICPYGAILRLLSPLSRHRVTITPKECVDCRLCEQGCPFGAIRHPTPVAPSKNKERDRTILLASIVAMPALVALFALLGRLAGPTLSGLDFNVKLAGLVAMEQRDGNLRQGDETKKFWDSGASPEELAIKAQDIRRRFTVGSMVFGAWVGAVIGMSFLTASIRRFRSGYTADAGTCVACARCYQTCPVEHARRTGRDVNEIVAEMKTSAGVN